MSDDDKRQAYIDALKTNRCVDIMKAYYEWRGEPQHKAWKDDTANADDVESLLSSESAGKTN